MLLNTSTYFFMFHFVLIRCLDSAKEKNSKLGNFNVLSILLKNLRFYYSTAYSILSPLFVDPFFTQN